MSEGQKTVGSAKESPWFILYNGTSPDGYGLPRFCGRTRDAKFALNHFRACARNPYAIGRVEIVTDTKKFLAMSLKDFADFIEQEGGGR